MVKEWDMVRNPLEMTWIIEPTDFETATAVTRKASTVPRVLSKRNTRHAKSTPNLRIAVGGHSASAPDLSSAKENAKAQSFEDLLQTTVEQEEHANDFPDSDLEDAEIDDDDRSGYAAAKKSVRDLKEEPYKEFLMEKQKRKTWSHMMRNSSLKKLSTLIVPPSTNKYT
jgi:hypothetical protein